MTRSSKSTSTQTAIAITHLIRAIEALPSDPPNERPGIWYKTQKEHWLGWLSQYDGPGAYGRSGVNHDARFAYNHIVNPFMLLWLISAAGVEPSLVASARSASEVGKTLMQKAGSVRKLVPWDLLADQLWPKSAGKDQLGDREPTETQAFNVTFSFAVPYEFEAHELELSPHGREADMVPKVSALDDLAAEVRDFLRVRFGEVDVEAWASVDEEPADDDSPGSTIE